MPHTAPRQPDHFKFRLLCKRCNSYMHTTVEVINNLDQIVLLLACNNCGTTATYLDEVRE